MIKNKRDYVFTKTLVDIEKCLHFKTFFPFIFDKCLEYIKFPYKFDTYHALIDYIL